MTDVRAIAYEALLTAEGDRSAGNLSGDVLDRYSYLDRTDRSFLKRLIEGTIERRITIDQVLDLYSKTPVAKRKKQIRTLLRMGTYQLLYMDGVTDYAAVNETVRLIKKTPVRSLSGFVNGVLRSIAKDRDSITWPDKDIDPLKYLSVFYSCPEWIVDMLISQMGEEKACSLLKLSVSARPVTARVNLSKTSISDVLSSGIGKQSDICPVAIVLEDNDNITGIDAFADGRICIQDISSMLVCLLAGIGEDDTILDLCAAPGGKSLHAADIATKGHVIACDVSQSKTDLIEENIQRCAFTNIETRICDATVYDEALAGSADIVIADVPCSGLGVMGRKNDIKYNITPKSIESLVPLQRSILKNAAKYVRTGGTLMFSTCTCSRAENHDNVRFLRDECKLQPVDFYDDLPLPLRDITAKEGYLQLYGKDMVTDGFFIAKFTK